METLKHARNSSRVKNADLCGIGDWCLQDDLHPSENADIANERIDASSDSDTDDTDDTDVENADIEKVYEWGDFPNIHVA